MAHNIPGNLNAFGTWNLHTTIPIQCTQALRMQHYLSPPTEVRHGKSFPACAVTFQDPNGNLAAVECVSIPFSLIQQIHSACTSPFRRRELFERTTAETPGSRS